MRKEFFEKYLRDFVSMTMKVGSDEELQVRVIKILCYCIHLLQYHYSHILKTFICFSLTASPVQSSTTIKLASKFSILLNQCLFGKVYAKAQHYKLDGIIFTL